MKPLIKVISYATELWPYYLGILASSILVALTGVAIPFVIKAATDLMVAVVGGSGADVSGALWLAVLLFVFDGAKTLIGNWGGYLGDVMASKMKSQLSTRYFEHLLALPQSFYDGELTGTIINRLNRAIHEVTNFANIFANNFFQMVLTAIITIGIIWIYSWELALLVFIIYPLFFWLTAMTSKKWQGYQTLKNQEVDSASGRFAEVVTQIKVVKSYVQEKLEHRHFRVRFHKTIELTRDQSHYWHTMDVVRGMVLAAIFFAIYAYIFISTVEQKFTIGEMVLLITLINMLRVPLFSMSFVVDSFQKAITGSKNYVATMELKPAITDKPGAHTLEVTHGGRVMFGAVDFAYKKSKPVLNKLTFTVEPGERVALIGESGQGKTTIANLLMRLYEPTSGIIAVDDTKITDVTQISLRKQIGTVFQDPALFSGTIRENIAYAHPRVTHERIEAAAKAANAHDFIMSLENGYDTQIGERGLKLSGGQKQRIAIARAILKDAPILLLDEATSSLDNRSEREVQEALDRLMQGRSTLIIAHRLSTIANVDKIVTLRGGRADEIGSPAQLATTGGIYAQLLQLQAGATPAHKKQLEAYEIVE